MRFVEYLLICIVLVAASDLSVAETRISAQNEFLSVQNGLANRQWRRLDQQRLSRSQTIA